MIFYTGIQKNSNYLINILHCILIMTEMQHCNSIGIVYFFFNINFCALVTIKLNVSLVYFLYGTWYFTPVEAQEGGVRHWSEHSSSINVAWVQVLVCKPYMR